MQCCRTATDRATAYCMAAAAEHAAPHASGRSRAVSHYTSVSHLKRARRWQRETCCSANRSTARETAALGTGCSRRRSVTCAGLGPARAVSRLSLATRRSHGSLPQHISRCSCARLPWRTGSRRTRAAGRVLRGATVSAVTREVGKTGSERDRRAGHGPARVAKVQSEELVFPRRPTGGRSELRRVAGATV